MWQEQIIIQIPPATHTFVLSHKVLASFLQLRMGCLTNTPNITLVERMMLCVTDFKCLWQEGFVYVLLLPHAASRGRSLNRVVG